MNIIDILYHVHPDLSEEQRTSIEEAVSEINGVMSVHFNNKNIHELSVAYDPDAIGADRILRQIREFDKAATMVGL